MKQYLSHLLYICDINQQDTLTQLFQYLKIFSELYPNVVARSYMMVIHIFIVIKLI